MRILLPALSVLVIAGSSVRLAVSDTDLTACRYFLCDEHSVVYRTYTQQVNSKPYQPAAFVGIYSDLLVRDPAEPMRWGDLGSVLADLGHTNARYCFDRASTMAPHLAGVQVYAGDFYLQQGDRARAFACFSRVLRMTRDYDAAIFSRYENREIPVKDLLDAGVPGEPAPARAYLRYLMRLETVAAATNAWHWLTARQLADLRVTADYARFLVGVSRFAEGAAAWASAVTGQMPGEGADYGSLEYVYDGGFEREPVGSPFDWSVAEVEHVETTREGEPHSGTRSLRIRFDGEANTDYHHLSQKTAVRPGVYRFRAFVKTEGITTDEGVRWQIVDAESPARLNFETEPLKGTRGWGEIEGRFQVGAGTRLLEIRLVRRPALKFDNKIAGAVWVDDVSLRMTGR